MRVLIRGNRSEPPKAIDPVTPTLDYRPADADGRPRWATRLGTAGVVLGTFGLFAGAARFRDAHHDVFDPTFRWVVAPPAWAPPTYLAAICLAIGVSAWLLAAGAMTLAQPALGRRLLAAYVTMKLPLIALTAACRAAMLIRLPSATKSTWLLEAGAEFAVFAPFPLLVLLVLWRTRFTPVSSRA